MTSTEGSQRVEEDSLAVALNNRLQWVFLLKPCEAIIHFNLKFEMSNDHPLRKANKKTYNHRFSFAKRNRNSSVSRPSRNGNDPIAANNNKLCPQEENSQMHFHFRIYLTDATPDNIVVNKETFQIAFIDLDNVILVDSDAYTNAMASVSVPIEWQTVHKHSQIDCDGCFAYVPEELASHHLSDINIFTICQVSRVTHSTSSLSP